MKELSSSGKVKTKQFPTNCSLLLIMTHRLSCFRYPLKSVPEQPNRLLPFTVSEFLKSSCSSDATARQRRKKKICKERRKRRMFFCKKYTFMRHDLQMFIAAKISSAKHSKRLLFLAASLEGGLRPRLNWRIFPCLQRFECRFHRTHRYLIKCLLEQALSLANSCVLLNKFFTEHVDVRTNSSLTVHSCVGVSDYEARHCMKRNTN